MQILILAALAEEADAALPGQGTMARAGWMSVRSATAHGHDVRIATTGIGKVNVAAGAALLHARAAADLFLIVGTAGKIGPAPGDCFWLAEAVQHDYGAERPGTFVHYDAGAWPIGPASVTPYAAIADPGLALPHVRIASGDAFIECPDHARFLSEGLSAGIVDMETGALAQLALRLGIGWGGIKATTDEANDESVGDFQANLRAASARAGAALERLLALLPAAG